MATSKTKSQKTKPAKTGPAKPKRAVAVRSASAFLGADAQGAETPPQGLFLSFFNAASTLEDAANVFRDQAGNQALPSAMREEAALSFRELKREVTDLEAAHSALEARLSGIGGPSEVQLRKAQSLSQDLARDIHRAELTVALITIVSGFIDAWARIG